MNPTANENENFEEKIQTGKIDIGDKDESVSWRERAAKTVAAHISNEMSAEENTVYDGYNHVARAVAVSQFVIGSHSDNLAKSEYDRMDFMNDEYLNRIGAGLQGQNQKELESYMEKSLFQSSQSAEIGGAAFTDAGVANISADTLSTSAIENIRTTGTYSAGGVTYDARINSDGSVALDSSKYGESFKVKENSPTTIEIDPTQNIRMLNTSIDSSCLSQEEMQHALNKGSFTRNGVTYNASIVDSSTVNISARALEGSTSYQAMCAQNRVAFSNINYQMRGTSLNSGNIDKLCKNGEYDLGGMKFSAIPNVLPCKDKNGDVSTTTHLFKASEYRTRANNANNEFTALHSKLDANTASGKADVVADIQRRGREYICGQSAWLKDNFDGKNTKSCISHLNKEIDRLTNKKAPGWKSAVASLEDQKNLLKAYEKHGGWVPAQSKNRNIMGRRIIANQVFGADMMRGANATTMVLKTTRAAYRAAAGATNGISYMGATFANRLVTGAVSKVSVGVPTAQNARDWLNTRQTRRKAKYDRARDKARAKRNGTYKQWKRDDKNRKFAERGNKLDEKATRIRSAQDKLKSQRADLSKNGKLSPDLDRKLASRQQRLDKKDVRHRKKQDKYNKKSVKWSRKAARKQRIHNFFGKIKNSPIGKLFQKISRFLSAPARFLSAIKAFLIKWGLIILGAYLQVIINLVQFAIVIYIICLFFSNLALPSDLGERIMNGLNGVNYEQLIVNVTEEDIVKDLSIICRVDATNHFLEKKHIPHSKYPWYYAAKLGVINNVWSWEESDNTSKYANEKDIISYNSNTMPDGATGTLIYANPDIPAGENGNTYVPQANRQQISNIEANLLPILTMGHMRYFDTIDFQTWPTVLGYTYYMFSVTHDIARYDTEAEYIRHQYGDYSDDPGYDYEIANKCPDDALYTDPKTIEWDPKNHTLTRGTEVCTNLYIHDFAKEGYTSPIKSVTIEHNSKVKSDLGTKAIRTIASMVNGLFSKVTGDESQKGDNFDSGYTDTNDIFTLNLRKKSLKNIKDNQISDTSIDFTIEELANTYSGLVKIDKNKAGVFMYDGTENSLPHAQPSSSHSELHGLGKACDQAVYFQYGVYRNDGKEKEEDLWLKSEGGNCEHVHSVDCFRIDPHKCPGSKPNKKHHHKLSCCDTSHAICSHGDHKPWKSQDDPGCWKTVAICPGHCGGHIVPLVNIVQKMTYEGLAQDDNFKTPHWLQAEEVINSAGYKYSGIYGFLDSVIGDNIVSVGQFRAYWLIKCNTWYSPIPRSPFCFGKTIIKEKIEEFCKMWDFSTNIFNLLLNKATGGIAGNYEPEKVAKDEKENGWSKKDETENDLWLWGGWWIDPFTIDESLMSELYSFTGHFYDNEFEAGKKLWRDFDVTFSTYGIANKTYSEEEITEIIDMIERNCGALSAKQRLILEAALSRCGTFSYQLTGQAHDNAIINQSGRGECSGWVTGTLLKALGINYDTNAAGYANRGTYNGVKRPGSIIAHKNGGNGYSGHVMIYAGYLADGPDGPGEYVLDCSSGKGGSSFRKVSDSYFSKYKYSWNP